MARAEPGPVLQELASRPEGLSQAEVDARLKQVGPNEIAREKRQSPLMRLLHNVKDPLVILLLALAVISFLTGDLRAITVIFVMVVLGVVLRFYQEMRADHAAEKQLAVDCHLRDHRCGGRLADRFAFGQYARVCPAAAAVLAAVGQHAAVLRGPDPVGEDMVLPEVWRMITSVFAGGT